MRGCNPVADTGDIRTVRVMVNGGTAGLAEMERLYRAAEGALFGGVRGVGNRAANRVPTGCEKNDFLPPTYWKYWERPQRDSNPCYQRERLVS
jgi:hypothetical protein